MFGLDGGAKKYQKKQITYVGFPASSKLMLFNIIQQDLVLFGILWYYPAKFDIIWDYLALVDTIIWYDLAFLGTNLAKLAFHHHACKAGQSLEIDTTYTRTRQGIFRTR